MTHPISVLNSAIEPGPPTSSQGSSWRSRICATAMEPMVHKPAKSGGSTSTTIIRLRRLYFMWSKIPSAPNARLTPGIDPMQDVPRHSSHHAKHHQHDAPFQDV